VSSCRKFDQRGYVAARLLGRARVAEPAARILGSSLLIGLGARPAISRG
jgi:hypothetical protein